jgi:MYXO-CTERM domain-containing protein
VGTGTNQVVAMGLNNNHLTSDSGGNFYMARILGYTPPTVDPDGGPDEGGTLGAGAFFKLNDFANSPLRITGWHNLRVEISTDDGQSADFAFYVNGILAERVSNVGTSATLRSYDAIRLGSGVSNAGNAAWYDNFSVQVIPEPSTMGLGLLGALLLACHRRRKA